MTYGKRIHPNMLPGDWQQPIATMKTLGIPAKGIRGFAAHCGTQGIAFAGATDSHLDDYLAVRQLSGELTVRSATAYRQEIVAGLRGLKELAPDAPATLICTDSTYALRQKQFDELPVQLKDEMQHLIFSKWGALEEKVVRARKNMILRHIELLENNGFPIPSLVDLATLAAFDRLTTLDFGAKASGLPASQSSFLTIAVDIASAWKRADLVRDLRSKMKTVKTPGGIAPDLQAKIFAFDDRKMRKLMLHATTALTTTVDDPHSALPVLQAALGVVLIGLSAQPVRVIRTARFTHGLDTQDDRAAFATISVAGRPFPLPENVQEAIGKLRWRLATVADSNFIFVKADGTLKTTSAITVSVNNLSEAAGARTDPQTLGGAVILSLLERGVAWQKVCQHIGWSQERNFFRRFRPLIEFVGQSDYADKAGDNR